MTLSTIHKLSDEEAKIALEGMIREAREAYYNGDEPIMSDAAFDAVVDKLQSLDPTSTVLAEVGAPTAEASTRHPIPMLSLAKVTERAELDRWWDTLRQAGATSVMVQPKLDGVSMSLEYKDGELTRAVTRGDGVQGEDVTRILRHLESVPTSPGQGFTGIVRGEVVIHRDELDPKFKNTRNAVSGCVNYKTKDEFRARDNNCRFYAFDLYTDEGLMVPEMNRLAELGFEIVPTHYCEFVNDVESLIDSTFTSREYLPFDIDGVVVKVKSHTRREKLGLRSNSPRWAVAYKRAGESVTTRLNDVIWQTGVGGMVTPVAVLEPVDLAGVTISRASLHNIEQIERLDIGIHDAVIVTRANDVIPQVIGVSKTYEHSRKIERPTHCPSCETELMSGGNAGQVACPNYVCKAQLVGRLTKWASRDGADIDAIGPKWIEIMVERDMLTGPADFYSLTRRQLMSLPRMGEKNVDRFMESIESSRACGMRKALFGLSIPFLGEGSAERLTRAFGSVEEVCLASVEELVAAGQGNVQASTIQAFVSQPAVIKQVHRIRERGVNLDRLPEDAPVEAADTELSGKKVAITGKLTVGRSEFAKLVTQAGGEFVKSVSTTTDYLVIADPTSTSSKAQAARDKGVILISEEQARDMMNL